MVTEKEVTDVLKECYDPEISVNIIDLGLVYETKIKEDKVFIKMTLTSPFCPMSSFIQSDIKNKLESLDGINEAEVEIVWEPPWSQDKMSEAAKAQLGIADS